MSALFTEKKKTLNAPKHKSYNLLSENKIKRQREIIMRLNKKSYHMKRKMQIE